MTLHDVKQILAIRKYYTLYGFIELSVSSTCMPNTVRTVLEL